MQALPKSATHFSKIYKSQDVIASGDDMYALVVGIGIFLIILGIVALLVPALARVINIPGNEKIKALGVIIVGIIFAVYGYFFI